MAHIGPDIPKALSAADTASPPFNAITAGYTTGRVNNNIPIASMNIPSTAYPRRMHIRINRGAISSEVIQDAKASGNFANPRNRT